MLHTPHFSCYTPPFVPVTKNRRPPVTQKTPQIGRVKPAPKNAWPGTRYLASALHGVEKAARYLDGPAIISRSCRSAWSVYSIQPNKPGWLLTI